MTRRTALVITTSMLALCTTSAASATAEIVTPRAGLIGAPTPIGPWVEETKATASDAAAGDNFGFSVAISGDTALVGAQGAEGGHGAAYVFVRSAQGWSEQAELTASDGADFDQFGYSVALAGDIAVVGSRAADVDGNENQGAAYVFIRDGETWIEAAKLTADDGAAIDVFGSAVAVSGNTVLVGAWGADVDGNVNQGAAYVFTPVFTPGGPMWREQAKLTAAAGAAGDNFGTSVALADDTALVGASGAQVDGVTEQGAAYVFVRSDGTWSEQARLTAADGMAGDELGNAVALSGATALVGARRADVEGNVNQGAAYVFTPGGPMWREQAKLTAAAGATGDNFGESVAVSGDSALVGAWSVDVDGSVNQGAAYPFVRDGETWSEHGELTASDGATTDQFGFAVAIAGDTALAGAWRADLPNPDGARDQGAAYVFAELPPSSGVLRGTVRSTGSCGDDSLPLGGAMVEVAGQQSTFTLTTDEDGFYQLFLDEAESPLDVEATASGHLPAAAPGVELGSGELVVLDFDLRLDAPCATVTPSSLSAQIDPDQTQVASLTIGNVDGVAPLDWTIETAGAAATSRPFSPTSGAVECEDEPGIIIHDRGTISQGISANPAAVDELAYVDRFTPSVYSASIDAVCVSFLSEGHPRLDFEIVVFDDDGPDGSPGTELGALQVTADGIPVPDPPLPPWELVWFRYDISSLGISIDSGSVYIGPRWAPSFPNVGLSMDREPGATPPGFAGGFWRSDVNDQWTPIVDSIPSYRSLMVRAVERGSGCDDPSTIPWLSIDPAFGSTPAGGTSDVQVLFDSAGLVPGEYNANLCLQSNSPDNPLVVVPVTLTVSIPPTFAIVEGTVEGLGYCGADPGPIADTRVVVESQQQTYAVLPDEAGFYRLGLDPVEGPVSITASAPGHVSHAIQDIALAAGETEIRDFGLVLEQPCVTLEPESLTVALPEGADDVLDLAVGNVAGGATLDWEITEESPETVGAVEITLTHSNSLDIQDGNDIGCLGSPDTTTDHQFLRTFTLTDFGIWRPFEVSEVTFGIERLTTTAPITVNLYTLAGELRYANLTLIGTATEELAPQELSLVTVPIAATVPPRSTLVVEIASPDLTGIGAFFPGSNDQGETAPSYVATSPCGIDEPVPFALVDVPDAHLVMTVSGEFEPLECALPDWTDVTPMAGTVPAGGDQNLAVTVNAAGLAPGAYETDLCIESNDPERPLIGIPLTLTVTEADVAELAFEPQSLDFGEVEVGSTSLPRGALLRNTGSVDITGIAFDTQGDGFEVDAGTCGIALGVGESCEVGVIFAPAQPGPASASLNVTGDPEASAGLDLVGMGVSDGVVTPVALQVDPEPLSSSDGDAVLEPGEVVEVAPAWRNDGLVTETLTGTASNLTGPDGAHYILSLEDADYGVLEPGDTASCLDTGICYRMGVDDPAARPAAHWDASFDETLSDDTADTWAMHVGDSFLDVPRSSPFYPAIETLLHHGVTGGCTTTEYCPAGINTRGQMAVFLLKAVEDADYAPPACVEGEARFADVPFDHPFCSWIVELAERGVTSGCGGDDYCPGGAVTRAQMAVFLLKAFEDEGYTPPECTSEFADVSCPSTFAAWIEELSARGITSGCGADPATYCPTAPLTRAQMAVFVTTTFGLTLYGP